MVVDIAEVLELWHEREVGGRWSGGGVFLSGYGDMQCHTAACVGDKRERMKEM